MARVGGTQSNIPGESTGRDIAGAWEATALDCAIWVKSPNEVTARQNLVVDSFRKDIRCLTAKVKLQRPNWCLRDIKVRIRDELLQLRLPLPSRASAHFSAYLIQATGDAALECLCSACRGATQEWRGLHLWWPRGFQILGDHVLDPALPGFWRLAKIQNAPQTKANRAIRIHKHYSLIEPRLKGLWACR